MTKQCYSCPKVITDISSASMFLEGDKQRYQCSDCMEGANCFTCECCGDGLAMQQVDYKSGYREWWCSSCTEDMKEWGWVSKNSDETWSFIKETNRVR